MDRQAGGNLGRYLLSGPSCTRGVEGRLEDSSIPTRSTASNVSRGLPEMGLYVALGRPSVVGQHGLAPASYREGHMYYGGGWLIHARGANRSVLDGIFFECTAGSGKLVGSFANFSGSVNVYRGKLLGLMAAHLVLLGMNTMHPGLWGSVTIYSDCLGTLDKVMGLPPL